MLCHPTHREVWKNQFFEDNILLLVDLINKLTCIDILYFKYERKMVQHFPYNRHLSLLSLFFAKVKGRRKLHDRVCETAPGELSATPSA